jgi:transposase
LLDLHGIGPSGAARLLVEAGDITRFPTKGHFASRAGTPHRRSFGDNVRHRLSRGGNRQVNKALHMMAVMQLRNLTPGRAYYDRKVAAGKTPNEAMRCLKRSCPTSSTRPCSMISWSAWGRAGRTPGKRL